MNFWKRFVANVACFIACALFASASSAATLIVQNGVLMGADNVLINGQSFTVRFEQGTCNQVYGPVYDTCNNMRHYFGFGGASGLLSAFAAQVFVDGPLGNFASSPQSSVAFCCSWQIPGGYDPGGGGWAVTTVIHNGPTAGYPDNYGYANNIFLTAAQASNTFNTVVDQWIVLSVPESATPWMFGLGAPIVWWLTARRGKRRLSASTDRE